MLYIKTKFFKKLPRAGRRFALLLLVCLAGGLAQAQTLSLSPGMVTALTSTDSTTGSADPKYTGPLSGLIVNQPQALTYDSQGDLFIVDAGANVVRVVASGKGPIPSLPSVSSPAAGTVYTVAGSGSNQPSSTQLCQLDQRSSVDNSFYGNGCPATDAILFLLTPNGYNGQTISPGGQTTAPIGEVALDVHGNLYIADAGDNQVRVVYAAGTVPGLLASLPTGVTPVPGNIYAFAGGPANQNTGSRNPDGSYNLSPIGVAVDASSDVYILLYNAGNAGWSGLAVVYNGGTLPPILAGQDLTIGQYVSSLFPLNASPSSPSWRAAAAMALDPSGNIYISDSNLGGNNSVYVIYAGGTVPGLSETLQGQAPIVGNAYLFTGDNNLATVTNTSAALLVGNNPTQLAIDSAGNIYAGLMPTGISLFNFITKVDISGNLALFAGAPFDQNTLAQPVCAAAVNFFGDGCPANQVTIGGPLGVAAAPDGSIDFADDNHDTNGSIIFELRKIDGSTSALTFPTQTAGVASPTQVVTVSNVDTQTLNIGAVNIPNNFTQVASGGVDCTAPTTLLPGQSCQVGVEFLPVSGTSAGQQFSDNITISSDSTNAASGVNSIAVSGTATAATGTSTQTINFTVPSTAIYAQQITLNATASSGLGVLYQVSGPGRLQGNTLTVTGVGPITVTAYQPGDNGDAGNAAGWAAATPVPATISAQPAPLTVTANSFDQNPGLPIPTLTYTITGFVNGDTQATATTGAPALSTTATATSAPGPYPITITQGTLQATTTSYSLNFVNGTFTIDARLPQTITFTQNFPTVTYGVAPIQLTGTASSGLPVVYTVTGPATVGGANGSTLTITGAGTVAVTATQPGNVTYAPATSVMQSFLVQSEPLIITADNLTMAAGSTVPTLTYTVRGFVNGDTAASMLTGSPKLSTTATSSSPVGTVAAIAITQGSLALTTSNYSITPSSLVNGTLTVVQGTAQTITFGALPSVTYGANPFVLNATASSGLPIAYTVSGGPASVTNNVLSVTGAGTVTVAATQTGNTTYSPAPPVMQSFNVAQAPLTVTANSVSRLTDTANNLSYTVTGFVNGDTAASAVSGSADISTTATPASPVGTYPISVDQGSLTATNYIFATFVPGTLTITTGGPAPNFTTSMAPPNLTILDGQVGQATLSITPSNYYQGVLNLSCTGLPANVSCLFSPASVNVQLSFNGPGGTYSPSAIPVTVSITTSNAPIVAGLSRSANTTYRAAITGWVSVIFGLILAWQRKRLVRYKSMWVIAFAACLFGMAVSMTACGGSSGSSSTSKGLAAPGTSTIQVVATDANGGPTHSIPLVITIK